MPRVLVCSGCGVRFQTVDGADGSTTITVLGVDPAWTPPTFKPILVVGDSDRRERIRESLLSMAMLGGGIPIGFGIPSLHQDLIEHEQELLLRSRLDKIATVKPWLGPFSMPTLPGRQQRRSLIERKARRAKRKQRRNR